MRICALVICALLVLNSETYGWSDAGHKIVASIAFRRLSPAEQQKVLDILRKHPRFNSDFTSQMPTAISSGTSEEKNEWLFQQAAIWPDIARNFPSHLKSEYHRSNWHFVNLPIYLIDTQQAALQPAVDEVNLDTAAPAGLDDKSMNIIQTIRKARAVIADDMAQDKDKGLMLAWLFHTVGDSHQPMHSSALFSENLFPKGDRGGNLVLTVQRENLHSAWDSLLGGKVQFQTAANRARDLMSFVALQNIAEAAANNLDEETWIKESAELAKTAAYSNEVTTVLTGLENGTLTGTLPDIDLSNDYMSTAGEIAKQRVMAAGFRLAAVLKELVD
ncbi:hypothetical protein GC163_21155 [bacterium]|nr:hypothetical protein [bacterium]